MKIFQLSGLVLTILISTVSHSTAKKPFCRIEASSGDWSISTEIDHSSNYVHISNIGFGRLEPFKIGGKRDTIEWKKPRFWITGPIGPNVPRPVSIVIDSPLLSDLKAYKIAKNQHQKLHVEQYIDGKLVDQQEYQVDPTSNIEFKPIKFAFDRYLAGDGNTYKIIHRFGDDQPVSFYEWPLIELRAAFRAAEANMKKVYRSYKNKQCILEMAM